MGDRCEALINEKRCRGKAIVRDTLLLYDSKGKLDMEVPLELCKSCLPRYNLEQYEDFETGIIEVRKIK